MSIVVPDPASVAHAASGLVRAIFRLITSSAGWMIIGISLLVGGLIWGLNSHQVTYVAGNRGAYDIKAYDGFYILKQENTGNVYVIQDQNFNQNPEGAFDTTTYQVPENFSFIASPNSTYVGFNIGFAQPVEKLTFDGATYISSEYQTYPHGYAINNWPYASPLMLVGALCIGLVILFRRYESERQKRVALAEHVALDAIPSPFARELAEDSMQSD